MSAQPNPLPKYITVCRECGQQFQSSPFDVPIIGKPNERVVKFVLALMQHLQKKHPQAMAQLQAAMQEFTGFMALNCFQIEDPQLLDIHNQARARLHKFTQRNRITDAEIVDRLARLGLNPEQQEGLTVLLKDMRDILSEEGRYAPKTPPASPITT